MARMILAFLLVTGTAKVFAQQGGYGSGAYNPYQMMLDDQEFERRRLEIKRMRYMGNTGGQLPMRNTTVIQIQQPQHVNPYNYQNPYDSIYKGQ